MQNIYNRYKLAILLSIVTSMLWAQTTPQPHYTLLDNQTGAVKCYVARDYVSMKPGFHYAASGTNTFNAKIDAGLLFPPTTNTYKDANGNITPYPAQGAVVGSIPGSASVTPTGVATYQIPIEVPQGVNGMQPQLTVVYNSRNGFGATGIGIGWELAGFSNITRGNKNIYFDNINDNIKFDNSDALNLDGKRLVYLSGGSGSLTDGATYSTEVENYESIVYSNGYFILTTVDGKTLEYGNTNFSVYSSKLKNANDPNDPNDPRVLAWKINKVTDQYGNTMTYNYSDNGQYIANIQYANNFGDLGVGFIYDDVSDSDINSPSPKNRYIGTFKITNPKKLHYIQTISQNKIDKYYYFSYNYDKLQKIENISRKDNSKTTTTINWNTVNDRISSDFYSPVTDIDLIKNKGAYYIGDVNGDGYPDRIEVWPGESSNDDSKKGHICVYLFNSQNKTFNHEKSTELTFSYDTRPCPRLVQPTDSPTTGFKTNLVVSDINNDGKDEIIVANNGFIYVYSFQTDKLIKIQDVLGGVTLKDLVVTSPNFFSANVNHDQFNDIVFSHLDDPVSYGYEVYYGGINGLSNRKIFNATWNYSHIFKSFQIGDFNADGRLDVLLNNINPGSVYSESCNNNTNNDLSVSTLKNWWRDDNKDYIGQADFNGDGRSDLLLSDGQIAFNNGLNNTPSYVQLPIPTCQNYNPKILAAVPIDINGDGQIDIAIAIDNHCLQQCTTNPCNNNTLEYTLNWYIYINHNGVFTCNNNSGVRYNSNNPITYFVADINHDGISDLIVKDYFLDSGNYFVGITCGNNANETNTISSVVDGLGKTTSFSYTYFNQFESLKDNENTSSIHPLRTPILVVDELTEPDESKTKYTYETPKVHTEGKGFLGFSTVTATNAQKNTKVTSNYAINQTYFFPVLTSQLISTATGTDSVSVSSQKNDVKVIDAINRRYIPIVTAQSSTNVLKGITQTGTTDYKDYPGKLTQTTKVGNLTDTTVTTFTGPWGKTPYLPAKVITTRTQDGKSFTRETDYGYTFDTGNPYKIIGKTETNDPGDANSVVTIYSNYDSWGHPQNIAVAAYGITRSSSVSYTSSRSTSGRFLQSKTNTQLNETTNYSWNETTGLLDSETDPRNHTTTYSYDGFGQLKETVYPDGNRKASVLQWAGTDGVTGAVYYSFSQVSGSAPITVWYDKWGREIQSDTYGLNNKKISVSTEYYTVNDFTAGKRIGRIYRVSEPYFEADAANKTWAKTYTYDEFGLPKKVVTPMGEVSTVFNKLVTTVTTPEGTTVTTQDSTGQTVRSNVNGKVVTYEYYASGLTKSSTPEGGQAISMVYNLQGKLIKLNDPDGGFTRSVYNGFGEQTLGVQRVHLTGDSIRTTYTYKPDGRLESINRNGEITTYTYDSSFKGRVNVIALKDKNSNVQNRQTFTYDPTNITDRVTKVKEEIGSGDLQSPTLREFNTSKEYDALGRVKKEIYPSGYYTVNTYDGYGNLTETKDQYNRSIWKANAENARGQLTSVNKGNKTSTYDYWDNGLTKEIKADSVVDMYYEYESQSHKLHSREDKLSSHIDQKETFGYDGLNRLTNWTVNRNGADSLYSISYDITLGNITGKSDLGAFTLKYGGERENGATKVGIANGALTGQHALTTIVPNEGKTGLPANIPTADLNVTYTDFKKIATLSEGTKFYRLTYGTDDERRKSEYYANGISQGNATLTRYQVGSYEEEINSLGNIRKIHYLSGAIYIQNGTKDTLYYAYADNQGSLIALTDDAGTVLQKYAYDPWGARRNPDNWTLSATPPSGGWGAINRGYTGHEHLDAFGIINMNGRVYDPLTAQFFSPDPFITDQANWLCYNRYAYCRFDPLGRTDPSGYEDEPYGRHGEFYGGGGYGGNSFYGSVYGNYVPSCYYNYYNQSPLSYSFHGGSNWWEFGGSNANGVNIVSGRYDTDYSSLFNSQGSSSYSGSSGSSSISYGTSPSGVCYSGGSGANAVVNASQSGTSANIGLAASSESASEQGGENFSLVGMYSHFQFGGTKPMTIKMSTVNFGGATQKQLGLSRMEAGKIRPVNLFKLGSLNQAALAFGNVYMRYHGNNQFSIVGDENSRFDFFPLVGGSSRARDAGNLLGAYINYDLFISPAAILIPTIFGGPYDVNFIGTTTIPK